MARRKVIVKRLAAIHDLGAMTVLCTDKTGTLTSAEITLAQSLDAYGKEDARAAKLGAIAASLGGDRGSLDAALVAGCVGAAQGWTLAGRQAFDFSRRLGSVLASGPEGALLIVKGAPEAVLELCTIDDATCSTTCSTISPSSAFPLTASRRRQPRSRRCGACRAWCASPRSWAPCRRCSIS